MTGRFTKVDSQPRSALGFLRSGSGAPCNQANFVPGRSLWRAGSFIPKGGANTGSLSPSFINLLAQDGIQLAVTDQFGKGLGNSQKTNFAPRVGFAYQITPKFVARGGFGLFYNGFENRGFSPNLGENYPFQFNFSFNSPKDDSHPIVYNGCTARGLANRQCDA